MRSVTISYELVKSNPRFLLLALIAAVTVGSVIFLSVQLVPLARSVIGQPTVVAPEVESATVATAVDLAAMSALDPNTNQSGAAATNRTPMATAVMLIDMLQTPLPTLITRERRITPASPATATPVPHAVVAAALVNVRSAPSVAGELLTQITEGMDVQLLGTSRDGAWTQICCPLGTSAEREAWVSTELLRPSQAAAVATVTPALAMRAANQANKAHGIGTVNSATVNVRSGPSTQYAIIGQVNEGAAIDLIGRTTGGDWLLLCCPAAGQESGWISGEFIDVVGQREALLSALPIAEVPPLPSVQSAAGPASAAITSPGSGTGPGLPGNGGFGGPGDTNPLTGLALAGGRTAQRPVSVCINNDPAARPQWGLSQADVLYEYLMEGYGITRFSAIFYGDSATQIGPVRSARLINYYMGALYDAGLVCSGASDQVRYSLKHEAPFPYLDIDLDDPSNSRYSTSIGTDYRTRLRTSTEGAHRWLMDWGSEKTPSLRGFTFGAVAGGGEPAGRIDIPYPRGTGSQVRYQYDAASGHYLRWLGGNVHADGNTGNQLALENVIVQYVAHEATNIVEDSLGSTSIRLNLFGSGPAIIFRDGVALRGTWHSESRGDLPRFYNVDGQEIALKVGRSWISVVPNTYTVEFAAN
ncbi:MAG: DUF3048 domain-containing protein [Caldilineaceae bacterium]